MTLLCRLNIHAPARYFAINTSGRYTLTCRRCGKECT
jgi:hypothetical protein